MVCGPAVTLLIARTLRYDPPPTVCVLRIGLWMQQCTGNYQYSLAGGARQGARPTNSTTVPNREKAEPHLSRECDNSDSTTPARKTNTHALQTSHTALTFTGTFRGRLASTIPRKYGGSVTPHPGCSTNTGGVSVRGTAAAAACPLGAPPLHTASGAYAGARLQPICVNISGAAALRAL